ncbi:MAG: hypothetical protein AB7P99_13530 [Vicinamibacterales bacterium]
MPHTSRSVVVLFGGSVLLGTFLAAVPRELPGIAVGTVLGGAWLSLVLAITLPGRAERAGAELARRLALFRDAVNAVGDEPSREDLEGLIARARTLQLRDDEIQDELARVHAALDALTLADDLAAGQWPSVPATGLAPGDTCRFAAPVRFGRRRADQFGQLLLTDQWLKFRGMLDVSVAWTEVSSVERSGEELIVSLAHNRRQLRFTCRTVGDAACGGVLAQHLTRAAQEEPPEAPAHRLHASM